MAVCKHLRVRNWDKYQHYKNRRPPWVKFYVELLDDYELAKQSYATRLLANLVLLLAARCDNEIPNDSEWIARQVGMEEKEVGEGVANLLSTGFLVLAGRKRCASKVDSKSLGSRAPAQSPETETEEETETERTGRRPWEDPARLLGSVDGRPPPDERVIPPEEDPVVVRWKQSRSAA